MLESRRKSIDALRAQTEKLSRLGNVIKVVLPVVTNVQVGGTSLSGSWQEGGTNFVVFDPMQELALLAGSSSAEFDYWCQNCGGKVIPEVINTDQLQSEAGPPVYQCFTSTSMTLFSICDIFRQWMYSSFWARQTGRDEAPQCGQYPV